VEGFLLLDPVLALGSMLASRELIPFALLIPLSLVLLGTLLLGRFFCSHVCPLGTLQDLAHWALGRSPARERDYPALRRGKYLVLAALVLAGLYGVNLTFWTAPLSLASRFFVLLVFPAFQFLIAPVGFLLTDTTDLLGTVFPEGTLVPIRYTTLLFHLLLFAALGGAVALSSRFWCRYLCPSGALFALIGKRPLVVRQVSESCTECLRCSRNCPMGAIDNKPESATAGECISCQQCARVCPEGAVLFGLRHKGLRTGKLDLPSRRQAVAALGAGFLLAFASRRGTREYWPVGEAGNLMPAGLIRPPGARPEPEFLNLCTRCGLCMKVCPTNMLQPAGYETGFSPALSPLAVPRRGPCEPDCNMCGQVCPTRAVSPLPLDEKKWAKMGTALVIPGKCLAWEFDRSCLVCDEACPYDAIRLVQEEGHKVAVPVVDEFKCAGCGWCEYRCPVFAEAAIQVTPMAALRLPPGDTYSVKAKQAGLDIRKSSAGKGEKTPSTELPGAGELPPGFSE
jgi:MauM/NapG family ferredoxin protein